jgi:hypothetical protein
MDWDNLKHVISALGFSEWLALASAGVAIISFLMSRATVRRQEAMQFEALRAQRDGDLITWADAAIAAIAEAQRHCRDLKNGLLAGDDALRNASEVRTRLSVLLDQGRLFFPNQAEPVDDDAEAAYVGEPHPAIDALYRCYRVISDLGRVSPMVPGEAVNAVVAQRRRFVSEVFLSVDPRRRQAVMSALDAAALGRTKGSS